MALCGSIGFTPIDFLLPCILWNVAKKPGLIQWAINWLIIIVYSTVAVVGEHTCLIRDTLTSLCGLFRPPCDWFGQPMLLHYVASIE